MIPSFAKDKLSHLARMRSAAMERDAAHYRVYQVRKGNMRGLFPDQLAFNMSFDGVPTANFIDNVARDLAETIAPLPSLDCTIISGSNATELKRAERKNRIGDHIWTHSRLETQMMTGVDQYVTYGFVPFYVEPDLESNVPYICVDDPRNAYYELDRRGRCKVYACCRRKTIDQLSVEWPEYESALRAKDEYGNAPDGNTELEVVKWVDDKRVILFLPEREGLILGSYEHKMSRTPVHIAERPGDGAYPRGQFDDVVAVQVARAIMSLLALEAAHTAVSAPIAVPADMDEFAIGPHSLLQTDNPQNVRRINLDLPMTTFAEVANLNDELKSGSRYPDARTGGVQASVITGKGIEAMLGTFDSQIKAGQMVFKEALEQITAMAFELDEAWFGGITKRISGVTAGGSYEFEYTPSKDIGGRYACAVTYGFAAGMNPQASVITMLQLEGVGAISKETMQSNLPFSIDPVQEQKKAHIQRTREALEQGMFSLIQSSGPLATSGQDPMPLLKLAVEAIKGLQRGKAIEDAVEDAYTAMEQAKAQAEAEAMAKMQEQMAAAGAPGAPGGAVPGVGPDGLPTGVAPGQAGLPPGGLPDIASFVSGFRGNAELPVNSVTVNRREPI